MFTKPELEVLLSAVGQWPGPYGYELSELNEAEMQRHNEQCKIASELTERFRTLLLEQCVPNIP